MMKTRTRTRTRGGCIDRKRGRPRGGNSKEEAVEKEERGGRG